MTLFWNSINVAPNRLQFSINWFKMKSTQWKKLNLFSIFLSLFKFYENFIFINQKFFIQFFNKVDYFIGSLKLYCDKNVFISCKLNSSVFLNSWSHQGLLYILIIDLINVKERNHCLFFFLIFKSFINRSFSIIVTLSWASIIIDILLGFLEFL